MAKIEVSKLGEDHVSVANSYNNLGNVADSQGELGLGLGLESQIAERKLLIGQLDPWVSYWNILQYHKKTKREAYSATGDVPGSSSRRV